MILLRVKLVSTSLSSGSRSGHAAIAEFNHAVSSICHPNESQEDQLQTAEVCTRLQNTATSNVVSYRADGMSQLLLQDMILS